ncbi:hypothetical protein Tsubulata_026815 [Turnera subulata]|uniref:BAG domain-containing protein n=1 Tax=Turnera subulata TaxID=218843 RepID=A0A9Q0J111_9ROSI|nr:hypothetical protein Tsubulata_026815 [Turnera subulata]
MHFPQQYQPYTVPPGLGPWPYSSGFGYMSPCNTCGGYAGVPGYYGFRPAFGSISSPFYQCCGHHPPYNGEYFPAQHVPPPHYSMDKPRYEYDKGASGESNRHCCGCPNHMQDQRKDGRVKVEELEPEAQRKGGESLIPFQLKNNYPYPVVWIPPEHVKNKEQKENAAQKPAKEEEKNAQEMKNHPYPIVWIPPENVKSKEHREPVVREPVQEEKKTLDRKNYTYPIVWLPPEFMKDKEQRDSVAREPSREEKNSQYMTPCGSSDRGPKTWKDFFAGDMKDMGSLLQQGKDGKKSQEEGKPDNMWQFPFPIIWMPSHDKQKEGQKEDHQETIFSSESTEHSRSPVKSSPKLLNNENSVAQPQGGHANSAAGEGKPVKSIPVKEFEEPRKEEKNPEAVGRSGKDSLTKDSTHILGGEATRTDVKRKSLSPSRRSKLPPVCLRVDPLPNKKNGKGSSRSPSPPGAKGHSHDSSNRTTKASSLCESPASSHQDSQAVSGDSIIKNEEKRKGGEVTQIMEKYGDERLRNGGDSLAEESKRTEERLEMGGVVNGKPQTPRRTMSHEEAARLIQSAFRGFEVRKWESLQKLKQLAKVREQITEVRSRIHSLSCSNLKDDKQKLVISEIIMSLLLKLDAIQGLHPDLRDVRKSIAKELVSLQEELDAIVIYKKSEGIVKEGSAERPSSDPSDDVMQNMEAMEQPSNSPSLVADAVCDHLNGEGSEPPLGPEDEHRSFAKDITEIPLTNSVDSLVEKELKDRSRDCTETQYGALTSSAVEEASQFPPDTCGGEKIEANSEDTCCDQTRAAAEIDEKEAIVVPGTDVSESQEMKDKTRGSFTSREDETSNATIVPEVSEFREMQREMGDEACDSSVSKEEEIGSGTVAVNDEEVKTNESSNSTSHDVVGDALKAAENTCEMSAKMESTQEALEESRRPENYGTKEDGVEQGDKEQAGEDSGIKVSKPPCGEADITSVPQAEEEIQSVEVRVNDDLTAGGENGGAAQDEELYPVREVVTENDRNKNQPHESPEAGDFVGDSQPTLACTGHNEEGREFLAASANASQLSMDGKDTKMESDRKLIEENEKLREMMEKLMEAGKEQLAVISNLTGRVKELEGRLSKKNRLKKTGNRRYPKPRLSCAQKSS